VISTLPLTAVAQPNTLVNLDLALFQILGLMIPYQLVKMHAASHQATICATKVLVMPTPMAHTAPYLLVKLLVLLAANIHAILENVLKILLVIMTKLLVNNFVVD